MFNQSHFPRRHIDVKAEEHEKDGSISLIIR